MLLKVRAEPPRGSALGSKRFLDLAKKQVAFLDSTLNLTPKAKILDAPCGLGRHSVLFAQKGYQVTGIDISKDCIKVANKDFKHRNVTYRLGNMADLGKYKGQYDAALNLFTSFGYFHSDKENEYVLRGMYYAIKPGGKVVLNLIDRDWILKIYQPARWTEEKSILTLEASRYDKITKYNESQMMMIDQRKKPHQLLHHHYHRVRLYSKPEIVKLFKKTGFSKVQVFGDFDGNRYSKGRSTHPIYIGTK